MHETSGGMAQQLQASKAHELKTSSKRSDPEHNNVFAGTANNGKTNLFIVNTVEGLIGIALKVSHSIREGP